MLGCWDSCDSWESVESWDRRESLKGCGLGVAGWLGAAGVL